MSSQKNLVFIHKWYCFVVLLFSPGNSCRDIFGTYSLILLFLIAAQYFAIWQCWEFSTHLLMWGIRQFSLFCHHSAIRNVTYCDPSPPTDLHECFSLLNPESIFATLQHMDIQILIDINKLPYRVLIYILCSIVLHPDLPYSSHLTLCEPLCIYLYIYLPNLTYEKQKSY